MLAPVTSRLWRVPVGALAGLFLLGAAAAYGAMLAGNDGFVVGVYRALGEAPHLLPTALSLLFLVLGWIARAPARRVASRSRSNPPCGTLSRLAAAHAEGKQPAVWMREFVEAVLHNPVGYARAVWKPVAFVRAVPIADMDGGGAGVITEREWRSFEPNTASIGMPRNASDVRRYLTDVLQLSRLWWIANAIYLAQVVVSVCTHIGYPAWKRFLKTPLESSTVAAPLGHYSSIS